MKTLVYQSYRSVDVPPWISRCLESVQSWAQNRGWEYRLLGDEVAEVVPSWVLEKLVDGQKRTRWPMVADLARLYMARSFLGEEFERVVWFDADVVVFDPHGLEVPVTHEFAFGREIWVQPGPKGALKTYRNIHNALSVYCRGNSFLDFYLHACLAILERSEAPLPPQALGPKFLTSLHNMVGFPVIASVGAFSPQVLRDVAAGGGPALDRLLETAEGPISAANLCASLVGRSRDGVAVDTALLEAVIMRLIDEPSILSQQFG